MRRSKPPDFDSLADRESLGPEDGTDLKEFLRKPTRGVKNRKALQLCAQVAQTVGEVLAGESGEAVLRDLWVEAVVPAPDSSRLLILLQPTMTAVDFNLPAAQDALARAARRLRAEVAADIHRKRVPELVYQIRAKPSETDGGA